MGNRLQDYKFVDFQGNILDSPQRIGNFLAEWGQKYAAEFPGKNPYDYGFGPQKMVTTTTSAGGLAPSQSTKLGDDPRWSNPAQLLAMNFYSNPETAPLLNNPEAVRQLVKDPDVYGLIQSNINGQAADMRSRDSGNIFSKAFKNLGTFASLAGGMSGLVGGLGALANGAGLTGAAQAGISAATNLPKQLGAAFFPGASANAVPGLSTGITTPRGGAAIIGSGQAAPLAGLQGGASLGANAGAVAGGAAAIPTAIGNTAVSPVLKTAGTANSVANAVTSALPIIDGLTAKGITPTLTDNTGNASNVANTANVTFADQGDFYNRLRDSVYDFHLNKLDDDMTRESRELKFELARRGHLGSRPEIDAYGDQRKLYDEGRLRIASLADNAANSAKIADQNTKSNAIAQIYAGLDRNQALASQVAQSQTAAQQATDAAMGSDIGDVLGKLGYLYRTGQDAKEVRRAVVDTARRSSGGVGPASSNYGTVRK